MYEKIAEKIWKISLQFVTIINKIIQLPRSVNHNLWQKSFEPQNELFHVKFALKIVESKNKLDFLSENSRIGVENILPND